MLAGVTALALGVVPGRYRALLFSTFDPEVADVSGVRVARTDALLMLVLSLAILSTLTIIGVTLVAATLVIPAVVARMLTDSFGRMLWTSSVLGASGGLIGMNLRYHLNVPSGTMIVLVDATVFCLALMATGSRGTWRAGGLDAYVDTPLAVTPSKLAERPGAAT